jgi:spermidine synthase
MFEELAHHQARIGELILRRRRMRPDGQDIWEIMLDGGYLMSSQFIAGEVALAELALGRLQGEALRVVVGGLGLGYTAKAALDDPRVARLDVVELVPEVIDWHRRGLLPLGERLVCDPRCRLVVGDFFAMMADPAQAEDKVDELDAILVDIDHSTRHLIEEASASFYQLSALNRMAGRLRQGGIFALWSSGAEDPVFMAALRRVFHDVSAERIEFPNPYREEPAFNIVYLGRKS